MKYLQIPWNKMMIIDTTISLSWILDRNALCSDINLVKSSLHRAELNLRKAWKRENYEQVLKDWETNGIVQSVITSDSMQKNGTHYQLQRLVTKEKSETSKIRPMYNVFCMHQIYNIIQWLFDQRSKFDRNYTKYPLPL